MLGIASILAALAVWIYTGNEQAGLAFALALAVGTIRFVIKFVRHRRQWAKFVLAS
jgi:hypothetical protein